MFEPLLKHIETWDDIKEWIISHAGELEYLKQYEGLDNFLGSGASGKVWKVKGRELTVKVTSDPDESAISNVLEGKDTKGFLKIHKCINVDSNPPSQLKIQEMCYVPRLGKDIRWFAFVQTFIRVYEKHQSEYTVDGFISFYEKNYPEYPENIEELKGLDKKEIQRILDFMYDVYQDTVKLGIEEEFQYLDVHGLNIMENKKGEYKLVDF
jgi:hypothetical protein